MREAVAQDGRARKIALHLRALEESLLNPAVRRSRLRLMDLLAEDFQEFGSSGRVWTRGSIIDLLEKETALTTTRIEDFHCALLAPEIALVTYKTVRTHETTGERMASLRSSVWKHTNGVWKMRFHQGTRTQ